MEFKVNVDIMKIFIQLQFEQEIALFLKSLTFKVWFSLVWFYGISTILGYLILNPFFLYIKRFYFKQFILA